MIGPEQGESVKCRLTEADDAHDRTARARSSGATIRGLDAADPVSEADFGQVLAALGKYGVLRFPDQHLDEEGVRRFSQLFGDIQGPSSGPLTKDGKETPVVGILSNIKENGKYIGAADAGQDLAPLDTCRIANVIGFL